MVRRVVLHNLDYPITTGDLREPVAKRLGIRRDEVTSVRILRRNLDARQHRRLRYVSQLLVELPADLTIPATANAEPYHEPEPPCVPHRAAADFAPVVIGAGPAGLFAALALAEAGLAPLLVERGKPVPGRAEDVERFWDAGTLDTESNMYFGEGGAGTFSDGKLNTRSKNPWVPKILAELVSAGAPEEILYDAHPHVGTDRLRALLPRLREQLSRLGIRFQFQACLTGLRPAPAGAGVEVKIDGVWQRAKPLVLACGHSAFDTYRLLLRQGVTLVPKANAFGWRIEHPAEFITACFLGRDPAARQLLGHAHYNLSVALKPDDASVYSFCCCPGGEVVACSAVPGQVSANGMSFSQRQAPFTNAAVVTTVGTDELPNTVEGLLAWREERERLCFQLGGGDFRMPAQGAADFVAGRLTSRLPAHSSRRPLVPADLGSFYPSFLAARLREGLLRLDRKVPGWLQNGLLIGVETTTSAPVRIVRTPQGESVSLPGLLPVGEGSGYAGGIVTSALDGYQTVLRWLEAQGS